VVRLPGATLEGSGSRVPDGWTHGGEVAVDGEFVRWRQQGLLWPWKVEVTLSRGRQLVALVTRS
jgi:hypothetical protein